MNGLTNRRASFLSTKIDQRDWKKAIIVRGKRKRPGRPPNEGEIAMATLKARRTDQIPRTTFSDACRLNRVDPGGTLEHACNVAAPAQPNTLHGCGHLDFLSAGYDTSTLFGRTVADRATAIAAMTDDHTAMFAGMARTAHNEGVEENPGRFEPLVAAGRSHTLGQMR
jgi:hypothetical protein